MLFTIILLPLLLSIIIDAFPSTSHPSLLQPNQLNISSSIQRITPISYICFTPAGAWQPLQIEDCEGTFREMRRDPDYEQEDDYVFNREARIAGWSRGVCSILVGRDDERRPPPYDIHFSTQEVVGVIFNIFQACQSRGHGGLAKLGRGYFVTVGSLNGT